MPDGCSDSMAATSFTLAASRPCEATDFGAAPNAQDVANSKTHSVNALRQAENRVRATIKISTRLKLNVRNKLKLFDDLTRISRGSCLGK